MPNKKIKDQKGRTALFSQAQKSKIKNTNQISKTSERKKIKAKSVEKSKNLKASKVKSVKLSKKSSLEASAPVSTIKTKEKAEKKPRITTDIIGVDGKVVGKVELPGEIFDAKVNPRLMAQAVRVYLANQRAGSASTKSRGEVRGSTRKIYRQKGTGRARHGAITAPIFVGGGIAFGPTHRDFSLKLPQKMRRAALFSALTSKQRENKVIVADSFANVKAKTKEMQKILVSLKLTNKKMKGDKVLFVLPERTENVERAARNIEGIKLERANQLHTYEVLNSNHILFLKDSIGVLEKTFLN